MTGFREADVDRGGEVQQEPRRGEPAGADEQPAPVQNESRQCHAVR